MNKNNKHRGYPRRTVKETCIFGCNSPRQGQNPQATALEMYNHLIKKNSVGSSILGYIQDQPWTKKERSDCALLLELFEKLPCDLSVAKECPWYKPMITSYLLNSTNLVTHRSLLERVIDKQTFLGQFCHTATGSGVSALFWSKDREACVITQLKKKLSQPRYKGPAWDIIYSPADCRPPH